MDRIFGRIQRIRIGDCVSRDILERPVVIQRSCLGLLSLIWFVNELAEIFKFSHVLFYADEMNLSLPVRGFLDCLKIQAEFNRLTVLYEDNELL
jgi:hypothetical protein